MSSAGRRIQRRGGDLPSAMPRATALAWVRTPPNWSRSTVTVTLGPASKMSAAEKPSRRDEGRGYMVRWEGIV